MNQSESTFLTSDGQAVKLAVGHLKRGHPLRPGKRCWLDGDPKDILKNLISKVSINESGCWIWKKAKNNMGYGVSGCYGKLMLSHRLIWKTLNGDPENLCVLHKCDTQACINPNHLRIGTKKDNTHDMVSKGRLVVCKGENNVNSVLTSKKVISIRKEYSYFKVTGRILAKKYGVSMQTIYDIKNRKAWKHI